MIQLEGVLQQQASGFNPQTAIGWHSFFWTEGTAMQALGYADTAAVGTWPNETGESNATEATNRPTWTASNSIYNNKPTVRYPADNSTLKTANFSSNPTYPISILVIGNMGRVPVAARYDHFCDGNDGTNRNMIGINASSGWWSIGAPGVVNSAIVADNNPHLLVAYFDGSTGDDSLDLDGTQIATGGAGSAQVDGLTVGSLNIGSYSCKGNIALLGIYSGAITAHGQWSAFKTWAASHFGLTIA